MEAEGSELGSPVTPAAPPPKRRKIEPPRRNKPSQAAVDKLAAPSSSSSVPGALPVRVDLNKVSEAKRFAVLQAQHEGYLGSYKSFDSHFGNYIVPIIPGNDFFEQMAK